MPIRVRELCTRSLEFAIQGGFLPTYERSGKYVEPPTRPHALALGKEVRLLAHYAACKGPLYAAERPWNKAYQFVRAYTKKGRAEGREDWNLERLYGAFPNLTPPDFLAQLCAAFLRQGFHIVDRNDVSATAAFTLEDSCAVMDLPEPYGKWLQLKQQRPRWKEQVALEIEARCRIYADFSARFGASGPPTYLDLSLSAPCAPLLENLQMELAPLLYMPELSQASAREALRRDLLRALRVELDRW